MPATNFFTTALAAAVLSQTAAAHIIMNTPAPFNYHTGSPLLQVNPLGGIYPFPCQGASTVNEVTTVTAGGSQKVDFTGQAVHGGGSCQFSITYDGPGADKSKWKAIYTLIGGCPASAAGNLSPGQASADQDGRVDGAHCGNDSGKECLRTFNVPIPKGLKNGNATFSWSWFNKIGNREMYQNCAPVTITGGTDNTAFFDSLPNMFVANVPGECSTGPEGVINIPNPGKYGKVLEQPSPGAEGACPKADGIPVFEAENGGGGASPTASPSGFTTITTSAVSSNPPVKTTPSPVAVPPPAPSNSTADPTEVNSQICSTEGAIVCIGTTHFGLCDHGNAVPQLLAPGTTCSNGVIS